MVLLNEVTKAVPKIATAPVADTLNGMSKTFRRGRALALAMLDPRERRRSHLILLLNSPE